MTLCPFITNTMKRCPLIPVTTTPADRALVLPRHQILYSSMLMSTAPRCTGATELSARPSSLDLGPWSMSGSPPHESETRSRRERLVLRSQPPSSSPGPSRPEPPEQDAYAASPHRQRGRAQPPSSSPLHCVRIIISSTVFLGFVHRRRQRVLSSLRS